MENISDGLYFKLRKEFLISAALIAAKKGLL
jgi:hypothetical protein